MLRDVGAFVKRAIELRQHWILEIKRCRIQHETLQEIVVWKDAIKIQRFCPAHKHIINVATQQKRHRRDWIEYAREAKNATHEPIDERIV